MLASRLVYLTVVSPAEREFEHEPHVESTPRNKTNIAGALATLRAMNEEQMAVLLEMQCAICLDELRDGHISALECSHAYHEDCLERWLRTRNANATCPMCKARVWPRGELSCSTHSTEAV